MQFDESVLYLISVIAGFAGMPVIGLLKKWAKVDGKQALGIATIASVVLAFVSVWISGDLGGVELTLEAVINSVGVVFGVATLFYKALQSDK